MSFRKRNVGLSKPINTKGNYDSPESPSIASLGIRPSPLDGRPTTSTGTQTLDDLLAGHAGLPLGHSILVEENGTTDFAGALLRYYAAEGVVQGHHVHVVGMPEHWGSELPGLVGDEGSRKMPDRQVEDSASEKMKIAWRYERLGDFGSSSRVSPTPNRGPMTPTSDKAASTTPTAFCHTFDLTKRLTLTPSPPINYIPITTTNDPAMSPYTSILTSLSTIMSASPPHMIHRLIIPSLLSPIIFPQHASLPTYLLPFLQSLRALLRRYPRQLTAMITLPLSLHPRATGLVRWIEHLMDGVLELSPFPHSIDIEPPLTTTSSSSGKSKAEEKPQGMVKIHRLPVLTEKGGGSGVGDDLAFSLGRKRFVVVPYHLPPVGGDNEAQKGEMEGGVVGKGIEF